MSDEYKEFVSQRIRPESVEFEEIRPRLQPFDLIFWRSLSGIPATVATGERSAAIPERVADTLGDDVYFTHVGIVVTSELLTGRGLQPGRPYFYESHWKSIAPPPLAGTRARQLFDRKKYASGVVLRDLEQVLADTSKDVHAMWGRLICNPWVIAKSRDTMVGNHVATAQLASKFAAQFELYDGRLYNSSLIKLAATVSPIASALRSWMKRISMKQDETPMFCSEFVGTIYQEFGIYPSDISPEDLHPAAIAFPDLYNIDPPLPLIVSELYKLKAVSAP